MRSRMTKAVSSGAPPRRLRIRHQSGAARSGRACVHAARGARTRRGNGACRSGGGLRHHAARPLYPESSRGGLARHRVGHAGAGPDRDRRRPTCLLGSLAPPQVRRRHEVARPQPSGCGSRSAAPTRISTSATACASGKASTSSRAASCPACSEARATPVEDVPDGTDGWSGRMMWREDGAATQYLYHPDQPGTVRAVLLLEPLLRAGGLAHGHDAVHDEHARNARWNVGNLVRRRRSHAAGGTALPGREQLRDRRVRSRDLLRRRHSTTGTPARTSSSTSTTS